MRPCSTSRKGTKQSTNTPKIHSNRQINSQRDSWKSIKKYSKDGYSPEIDLKWSGYGSSKLTEMLGLPEDVQEAIPVDATVRDIRDAKGIIRETEHNYSNQMELCDIAQPDSVETNWLTELIKQYFSKENREAFQKMTDWLRKR